MTVKKARKAGVAIETYKREIFEKRLKEAKFKFETLPGIIDDTLTIQVEVTQERFAELSKVVRAANEEARHANQLRKKH